MDYKYHDSDSSKQSRLMTKQELNMQFGKAAQIHEMIEGSRMHALMENIVRWKYEAKPQIAKITDKDNNLIGYIIAADCKAMEYVDEVFGNSEQFQEWETSEEPSLYLKKVGDL